MQANEIATAKPFAFQSLAEAKSQPPNAIVIATNPPPTATIDSPIAQG